MSMFDKIQKLRERFKDAPPTARSIYFMDRQEAYSDFTSSIRKRPVEQVALLGLPISGVHLFNLSTKNYVDGMPQCCSLPGIWAIMSDGTYKQLDACQQDGNT